jgi:hypothetical protein
MTVTVSGRILRANGEPVRLQGAGKSLVGTMLVGTDIPCELHIEEETFSVTLETDTDGSFADTLKFGALATSAVEVALLPYVLHDGEGARIQVERCATADGRVRSVPGGWIVSTDPMPPLDAVRELLASNQYLRNAVRDFNNALLDAMNAPVFLYRTFESSARAIVNHEGQLQERDWRRFREATLTLREDIEATQRLSEQHRHGYLAGFTPQEHLEMMSDARSALLRTIRFLLEMPVTPADDDQTFPSESGPPARRRTVKG